MDDSLAYVKQYQKAWNQINGRGSWEKNCWVWVYEWESK